MKGMDGEHEEEEEEVEGAKEQGEEGSYRKELEEMGNFYIERRERLVRKDYDE